MEKTYQLNWDLYPKAAELVGYPSTDYFCIHIVTLGTKIWAENNRNSRYVDISKKRPLEYSLDKINWTRYSEGTKLSTLNCVYFRTALPAAGYESVGEVADTSYWRFAFDGPVYISGKISTLLCKDYTRNDIKVPCPEPSNISWSTGWESRNPNGFGCLFDPNAYPINNSYYVPSYFVYETKYLDLNVDINDCPYAFAMSFACTNIKKLPIMPRMNSSSNLSAGCFREMFYNCERLEETPALPAINLGKTAYYDMFHYCRKLKQLPKLQALTLNFGAYASMFIGCENIKVSKIQTNEYQYEFRIPDSGTATVIQPDQPSDWNTTTYPTEEMLAGTGGTFTREQIPLPGTTEHYGLLVDTVYYTDTPLKY